MVPTYPFSILLGYECTPGVDHLGRHAILETLTTYPNERTIVFIPHAGFS